MDRQQSRLTEQLQNIQHRQRKVIQQLQAENARLLSDIADVCRERDVYRGKAAVARRENVELQNKLEEALTKYEDLKRGRTTVVRFVTSAAENRRSARFSDKERSINHILQASNTLSVVNEEQTEPDPKPETTNMEKAARQKLRSSCLQFPNPPNSLPHPPVSSVVPQPAVVQKAFR